MLRADRADAVAPIAFLPVFGILLRANHGADRGRIVDQVIALRRSPPELLVVETHEDAELDRVERSRRRGNLFPSADGDIAIDLPALVRRRIEVVDPLVPALARRERKLVDLDRRREAPRFLVKDRARREQTRRRPHFGALAACTWTGFGDTNGDAAGCDRGHDVRFAPLQLNTESIGGAVHPAIADTKRRRFRGRTARAGRIEARAAGK